MRWLRERGRAGEPAAEFAETLVLILFGCGAVAQVPAAGLGDHDSIAWGWGPGVTFGVYVAGRVLGGIAGAGAHRLAIGRYLPAHEREPGRAEAERV